MYVAGFGFEKILICTFIEGGCESMKKYMFCSLVKTVTFLYNANNVHYCSAKAGSTVFSTSEFILERSKVETALFKNIRDRLGGKCCEKDCDQDSK